MNGNGRPDSVVHYFRDDLNRSLELSDEGDWVGFYMKLWPELVAAIRIDKNNQWQKWGVDRMLLLPNGRRVTVDEKKRLPKDGKSFDDFLCEEWSNLEQRKVGWTLDDTKRCDLIAYAISGLNKCYLLPFELLRITAKANLEKWKTVERMYPKDAPNHDKQTGRLLYYTRNCAVSWDRLFSDMRWQMQRRFGSTELQLPTAVTIEASNQLNFIWGGPEDAIHKNQR